MDSPEIGGGRCKSEYVDAITRHRLRALGFDPVALMQVPLEERMDAIHNRFLERFPFENLSNGQSCAEHPDQPEAWPRATDRLLRENQARGYGGTSFTLTYALRDLLHGTGANAHCLIGRNLVTEEAHAAVLVFLRDESRLYDPSLLARGHVPLRPGGRLEDPLGDIRVEPRGDVYLTVSILMPGSDAPRPVYAIVPIPTPPHRFRQAWIASFCRGRRHPLRLARRVGDEIRRFSETPRRLEILTAEGRTHRDIGPAPVDELHELFGIAPDSLRAWFQGELRDV